MDVYEIWLEIDEYRVERDAICNSEETAMEYTKHVHNWFRPQTLFEQIQECPKDKKLYIRKRHILNIEDVKERFKK